MKKKRDRAVYMAKLMREVRAAKSLGLTRQEWLKLPKRQRTASLKPKVKVINP